MQSFEDFPERSAKPFRVSRIPAWPLTGNQLETDQTNTEQNYADILGCSLFQKRDDVLLTFAALAEDETYRAKLGTSNTAPFAALGALTPEQRSAALKIAEIAMNRMIESFAHCLAAGERIDDYEVEYKVEAHLSKISSANTNGVRTKMVAKCKLVSSNGSVLENSFGRWLNMFGKH